MTDTFASPARERPDEDDPDNRPVDRLDDDLCERYAAWLRTRRFYTAPPATMNLLAKLRARTGPMRPNAGGRDAINSPVFQALHRRVLGKALDKPRMVWELHYLHGVRVVKLAAEHMEISRSTWYRYLAAFRREVVAEALREVGEPDHERPLQQAGTDSKTKSVSEN